MKTVTIVIASLSIAGCVPEVTDNSSSQAQVQTFEDCLIEAGDVYKTNPRECRLDGSIYSEDTRIGHKGDTRKMRFLVSSNMETCQGIVGQPSSCLVVNGQIFGDQIEGYTHKEGRSEIIRVLRTQYCDPSTFNDCPQDVGIYRYRLISIE